VRSALIGLVFCATALSFAKQEFWDLREPSDWTAAEVQIIATNSPWAKKTKAEVPPDSVKPMSDFDHGYSREAQAARSRGISNSGTATGMSIPTPQAPKVGGVAFYGETLIRWESAPPIAAVMKIALPQDKYSISVTGLPASLVQSLLSAGFTAFAGTNLKFKGQPPLALDSFFLSQDKRMLVFAFSPANQPAPQPPAADGNAIFTMNCRGLLMKTTFDLKTMTWRGKLAL